MKFPVRPLTTQQLDRIAHPALANQPEAVAWDLFDTQTYVSGTTTTLTFFQTTSVDASITNMETAGQLPDPKWFRWYYFFLDILRRPTENTAGGIPQLVPGALDDVQQLVMSGRGNWRFNLQDKLYGRFPLSRLHESGGQRGFSSVLGTLVAPNSSRFEYANNSDPASTFCWDGSIVIAPKVGFSVIVEWPAALTLTANVDLRLIMAGVLFRAVR